MTLLTERYLDLLKSALVNELYVELEAQLLMSVLCSAQNLVMDLPEFWAVRKDTALLEQLMTAKQDGETILLDTQGSDSTPGVDGNLRNYSEFSYTLVGRKRRIICKNALKISWTMWCPGTSWKQVSGGVVVAS